LTAHIFKGERIEKGGVRDGPPNPKTPPNKKNNPNPTPHPTTTLPKPPKTPVLRAGGSRTGPQNGKGLRSKGLPKQALGGETEKKTLTSHRTITSGNGGGCLACRGHRSSGGGPNRTGPSNMVFLATQGGQEGQRSEKHDSFESRRPTQTR